MSEQKNITKPKQKQTNKHAYLQLKNRASNSLEMDLKQICAEGKWIRRCIQCCCQFPQDTDEGCAGIAVKNNNKVFWKCVPTTQGSAVNEIKAFFSNSLDNVTSQFHNSSASGCLPNICKYCWMFCNSKSKDLLKELERSNTINGVYVMVIELVFLHYCNLILEAVRAFRGPACVPARMYSQELKSCAYTSQVLRDTQNPCRSPSRKQGWCWYLLCFYTDWQSTGDVTAEGTALPRGSRYRWQQAESSGMTTGCRGHLILFMLNTPPHTKQQYPIVYYVQLLFRRCDPNIKSHPAFVYGSLTQQDAADRVLEAFSYPLPPFSAWSTLLWALAQEEATWPSCSLPGAQSLQSYLVFD
ncbi:hypothetical protein Anapl_17882 [Anas platyrhynchos]|uniref:Uncharacterized protein n=1 Tax=Anas platyrhynchos TaxID=8839 RepID=R0JIM1_ANAPL|nr:hypothetical protein Anapl_17882 [Anas platyrhynchos]